MYGGNQKVSYPILVLVKPSHEGEDVSGEAGQETEGKERPPGGGMTIIPVVYNGPDGTAN